MNQQLSNNPLSGLISCSRYAFMPNRLQYCGGDHNQDLFVIGVSQKADPFLTTILKEFQTLYPYLKLIADNNQLKDIFSKEVVEAYWLGNSLLENSNMNKFYWHLIDNLKLKKKMSMKSFEMITGKIPNGAIPYHNFHVFNIWLRTGNLPLAHTLTTMDNCRISWGKVLAVSKNELTVESPRLIMNGDQLALGELETKKILYKFLDQGFVTPQIDDLVSIHWNWACEVITEEQKNNLEKYTKFSINIANKN